MRKILVILSLFAIILLLLCLDFNGVFMDEEYYIKVGKSVIENRAYPNLGNPLSVMFGFYLTPMLLFLGDSFGGLLMARAVNVMFIVGMLVIIYLTTDMIFSNKKISLVSFLLSLFFAPIFFIGRFATLDASSLFFTTLSLFFIVTSDKKPGRKSKVMIILASFSMVMSFLSKYVSSILFIPLLFMVLYKKGKTGLYFLFPYVVLVGIYIIIFANNIIGLLSIQMHTQYTLAVNTTMIFLIIPYLALCIFSDKKKALVMLLLGIFAVVLMQTFIANSINAFKHASFAFILLAPFASSGLYRLMNKKSGKILGITIIFIISFSFVLSTLAIENTYPNEKNASVVLDSIVNKEDAILADSYAYRYYAKNSSPDKIQTNQWYDFNGDGFSNKKDYESSIKSGVFRVVMTSDYYFPRYDFGRYTDTYYRLYYEENQTMFGNNYKLRIYVKKD